MSIFNILICKTDFYKELFPDKKHVLSRIWRISKFSAKFSDSIDSLLLNFCLDQMTNIIISFSELFGFRTPLKEISSTWNVYS